MIFKTNFRTTYCSECKDYECIIEQDAPFQLTQQFTLCSRLAFRIKSVLWEYSCHEEYLEEFSKGKMSKYSQLLAALQWNRLDPAFHDFIDHHFWLMTFDFECYAWPFRLSLLDLPSQNFLNCDISIFSL